MTALRKNLINIGSLILLGILQFPNFLYFLSIVFYNSQIGARSSDVLGKIYFFYWEVTNAEEMSGMEIFLILHFLFPLILLISLGLYAFLNHSKQKKSTNFISVSILVLLFGFNLYPHAKTFIDVSNKEKLVQVLIDSNYSHIKVEAEQNIEVIKVNLSGIKNTDNLYIQTQLWKRNEGGRSTLYILEIKDLKATKKDFSGLPPVTIDVVNGNVSTQYSTADIHIRSADYDSILLTIKEGSLNSPAYNKVVKEEILDLH